MLISYSREMVNLIFKYLDVQVRGDCDYILVSCGSPTEVFNSGHWK